MNKKVTVSGVAAVLSLAVSAAAKKPYVETGIALKGNAENANCRSFVYELSKEIYEPAFDAFVGGLRCAARVVGSKNGKEK